jgi:hypothetical protein
MREMARILISIGAILLLWFLLIRDWAINTMTDGEIEGVIIIAFFLSVGMVAFGNGVQMWIMKD